MKRIAFVSPFTNTTNRYIDLQKQILSDCGFDVRPLSIKSVLTGRSRGIMLAQNLMVFHWLETRPFKWKGAHPTISLKGLLEFCFYVLLMVVARAKVVYFVHDHAVHDTTGWKKRFSKNLIDLINSMADLRVVHDPSFCDVYQALYLPHPLYWDTWSTTAPQAPPQPKVTTRKFMFGMLGAVRPYKAIHRILQEWPKHASLTIQGRATAQYEADIRTIIQSRQLTNVVDFQPRFLSDDEFTSALNSIDTMILGHAEKSMLVSGAFFEAIGRVPKIYARSTPFMAWVASQLPGICLFEQDHELMTLVNRSGDIDIASNQSVHEKVLAMFGRAACSHYYGTAFL
jgi:beta-1,4-mannosyltransferase